VTLQGSQASLLPSPAPGISWQIDTHFKPAWLPPDQALGNLSLVRGGQIGRWDGGVIGEGKGEGRRAQVYHTDSRNLKLMSPTLHRLLVG
jgi:hypothetical protein